MMFGKRAEQFGMTYCMLPWVVQYMGVDYLLSPEVKELRMECGYVEKWFQVDELSDNDGWSLLIKQVSLITMMVFYNLLLMPMFDYDISHGI